MVVYIDMISLIWSYVGIYIYICILSCIMMILIIIKACGRSLSCQSNPCAGAIGLC